MGILIAYLLGVLSGVGRKNSHSHNIHTHADGGNSQALPDGPISVVCIPPAPTDEERAKQKKSNRRKAIKFWAEIIGLIVLAVYTGFTAVTYFQIKKSAQEATRQFRMDQRAWIALGVNSGTPKVGKNFPVTIGIENSGKTPAVEVRLCGHGDTAEDRNAFPGFSSYGPRDCTSTTVLPPVGTLTLTVFIIGETGNLSGGLHRDQVESLISGKVIVRFYGEADYSDIFACKHVVKYCYQRVVAADATKTDWLMCKTGNSIDTDQECMQ